MPNPLLSYYHTSWLRAFIWFICFILLASRTSRRKQKLITSRGSNEERQGQDRRGPLNALRSTPFNCSSPLSLPCSSSTYWT
ncbi:hypothetical protein BVRB_2g024830 [Beta vulgaris subsp. vulgaris]|nr:hypothetical protein BVRB_2g024830 [Beta vulgaris subsp. vulgaris]